MAFGLFFCDEEEQVVKRNIGQIGSRQYGLRSQLASHPWFESISQTVAK